MIEFEVVESSDLNSLSTYQFFQNQIYIGRTSGDLVIQDSSLRTSHGIIEIVENELLFHPQKDVEFFLINGKRATTIRKIKVQDKITVGQTVIQILRFGPTFTESRKAILDRRLNTLIEENSPTLSIIENLSQLMK